MSSKNTIQFNIAPALPLPIKTSGKTAVKPERLMAAPPSPAMYLTIFGAWIASLVWFQPRLLLLLDMAYDLPSRIDLATEERAGSRTPAGQPSPAKGPAGQLQNALTN